MSSICLQELFENLDEMLIEYNMRSKSVNNDPITSLTMTDHLLQNFVKKCVLHNIQLSIIKSRMRASRRMTELVS